MQNEIIKYPVNHPLLKNYIKFFWEFHVNHMHLNHRLIPQRNINLRFNLSETPHILSLNGQERILEDAYFFGLQDHFTSSYLKINGRVHTLGICFYPDGFYPFMKIPTSEFKNQLLGVREVGCMLFNSISERLLTVTDTFSRLEILECELLSLLIHNSDYPNNFSKIFHELKKSETTGNISDFCKNHNISVRKLERLFNKYVGVSASTFTTLNRFHSSLNHLLNNDFSKLSDLAYDNGYFDQTHFIKVFKRFTGNTPKSFMNQRDSILHIGKLT